MGLSALVGDWHPGKLGQAEALGLFQYKQDRQLGKHPQDEAWEGKDGSRRDEPAQNKAGLTSCLCRHSCSLGSLRVGRPREEKEERSVQLSREQDKPKSCYLQGLHTCAKQADCSGSGFGCQIHVFMAPSLAGASSHAEGPAAPSSAWQDTARPRSHLCQV